MKKMLAVEILVLILAVGGCATLANLKAKQEARAAKEEAKAAKIERLKWWNEALGGVVLEVDNDYLLSDLPHTWVKTSSGIQLVFQ